MGNKSNLLLNDREAFFALYYFHNKISHKLVTTFKTLLLDFKTPARIIIFFFHHDIALEEGKNLKKKSFVVTYVIS